MTARKRTTRKKKPKTVGPVTLTYRSNNSGGYWWLTDQDWKDLEKVGWTVTWKADEEQPMFKPDRNGRWLGALATTCEKVFDTPEDGIREWEIVTGQSAGAVGCNCCGQPHEFSWIDAAGKSHYVSLSTPDVGTLEYD